MMEVLEKHLLKYFGLYDIVIKYCEQICKTITYPADKKRIFSSPGSGSCKPLCNFSSAVKCTVLARTDSLIRLQLTGEFKEICCTRIYSCCMKRRIGEPMSCSSQ